MTGRAVTAWTARPSVAVVPGRYTLVASDRRSVASVTTVALAPGEVVHVQLDLQPATKIELEITGARQGGRDPVELEVRDEHGALLLREGVSHHLPLLPAGVYHVGAIQGRRLGPVSVVTMPREAGAAPIALRL